MSSELAQSRAAIVIAHPGHELRVYHWLRLNRPTCFVLTDGSGRSGTSRLASTTRILRDTGSEAGGIYGRLTDAEIYSAMMNGDLDLFIDFAEEIAEEFINREIEIVAGDALEGYNPAHDVCRFIINAAVARANRQMVQPLENLEVLLTGERHKHPERVEQERLLTLDSESCAQKIEAVRSYIEIGADVDDILARQGIQAIQIERLRHVCGCKSCEAFESVPFYEIHGEKQVRAGHYERVLRFDEHVRPIAEALTEWSSRQPSLSRMRA